MLKNKRIIAAILSAVMLLGLAGCAGNKPSDTGEPATEASEESSYAEVEVVTDEPETETMEPEELGYGDNGFALIDKLYSESSDNIVVSNTSINMALAMLLEGANGETQTQIENYLGQSKEEAKEINKAIVDLFNSRNAEELKISIANSLWADDESGISEEYANLLEEYFRAEAENLDFTDPESVNKINSWVSDKTNGLINNIVDENSLKELESLLVNAIYFKGTWVNQYYGTEKGLFNGKEIEVLKSVEDSYFENDKAIAFSKPYYGGFEFVGILPKEEGEFTLSDLDIEGLMKTRSTKYDVMATMPKFKVEYSTSLVKALSALGIQDAFIPDVADLTDIREKLFVTDAIHKTYVDVNENGTEAAAVTAMAVGASSVEEPKEVREVTLDRPFVFMIYDTMTHTALFTGKIVNLD